ncbi:cysteine-rich receptor-like protein kinase 2 [Rhododendron vialii]|uniref:cysteine-rich receptor-like protein kinase 2 n=1 Tax=Rhododendron vialii TaxID=182163 RepID=UPI00265E43CD|nr:cysteine-rich receptor-like protein kinase 2 [Rhododendron vialii]XP_058192980.1 cysteine-rich receptor-like protein kinase 2 [Rhododendron vialii]XP_058192981.1 cysteine-rich receptor-like protein kinase 2 [Rhododendron vialii]
MKKPIQSNPVPCLSSILVATLLLLLPNASLGDPRAQTVRVMCGNQLEHNATIYVPNFVATMENISVQMRTSGFGIAVTGSGPDTNYGVAQCYGDLTLPDCVLCYAEARTVLPQCFPFNGGRIFLNGCFMRAENYSFFQEYSGPQDTSVCGNLTQKNSAFKDSARQAVTQVVDNGLKGNGFARAQVAVSGATNESVFVLADCWRTLSANSCRACLENASQSVLGCLPWSEGRALNTGCFLMYSDTNFLNPVVGNGNSRVSVAVIVVAVVSSVLVLVVGGVIGIYMWKRRVIEKKRRGSNDAEKLVKTLHDSSLNFKYSTLEKATESFDEANKLGHGGFGTVYKGVLPDGREIAVKRLFFNNRHRAADFYNEVNIISSVEHKNLVRLLGCSCSGPESLLVYEFLPNRSLDRFIFNSDRGKTLNWEKRYEIIIGTAEGLVYLHENNKNRIIHRDIKASNILLDSRLRAKIADFGLARSFQEDKSHISTAIAGTLGYMAPEYLAHGQLTEKADVYSFGVLLLEIVIGRQNNKSKSAEYSESLVIIAWKHFQQGTVEELFDPNLMLHNYHHNPSVKNEVLRIIHIGLLCTQEAPSLRPSMSKALQMLAKTNEHLPPPSNPPFVDEKTMELNDTGENPAHPFNGGNSASVASVSHSSFYPR